MNNRLNEEINNVSNIRVWVEDPEDSIKFEHELHSIGFLWPRGDEYQIRDGYFRPGEKTFIFDLINKKFDTYSFFNDKPYENEINIKILDYKTQYDKISLFLKTGRLKPTYKAKKIIKESVVEYPYRFKTEEEFIEEFGEMWIRYIKAGWVDGMDYLFGQEYPYTMEEIKDYIEEYGDWDYLPEYRDWAISPDMLILKPKNLKPTYKPKNIIKESYESNFLRINVWCDTIEKSNEFEDFLHKNGWIWSNGDLYLGKNLANSPQTFVRFNKNNKTFDSFTILKNENDRLFLVYPEDLYKIKNYLEIKPSYKSKQIIKESIYNYYRIKTKEELIEEFGENWNDIIENKYMWNSDFMDYLFGKKLHITENDINNAKEFRYGKKFISIQNEPTLSGVELTDQEKWFISVKLITKISLKPTYKSKQIIKESISPYPYRFKTEEEFIEEFGEDWKDVEPIRDTGWNDDMNELFGQEFPFLKEQLNFDDINPLGRERRYRPENTPSGYIYISSWFIIWEFLTINQKSFKPNYKPKQIIKESKNPYYPFRFKTEQEFIEKFGENWRENVRYSWVHSMDYLLGKDYPYISEEEVEYFKKNHTVLQSVDRWSISYDMLKLKEKPSYKPKIIIKESISPYPYRFKTEQEFFDEYGEFWFEPGILGEVGWPEEFDDQLGKVLPFLKDDFLPKENDIYHEYYDDDINLNKTYLATHKTIKDTEGFNMEIYWTMLTDNEQYKLIPSYKSKEIIKESNKYYNGFIVEINSIDDLEKIQKYFPDLKTNINIDKITVFPNWVVLHDNFIYIWSSENNLTPENMLKMLNNLNLEWLCKKIFEIKDLHLIKKYMDYGFFSPSYNPKNIIKESYNYEYDEIVLRVKTEEDIDTLKNFLNKLGINSTNTNTFKNYILPNYLFLNILHFYENNFLSIVAISNLYVSSFLMTTCIYEDDKVNNHIFEINELDDIKKILLKNSKLIPRYNKRNIIKESLSENFYYVFKTKEELIEEFGDDFRIILGMNRNGYMDYLLGTTLDLEKSRYQSYKELLTILNNDNVISYDTWLINENMLKKMLKYPTYKPKIIKK